MKISLRPMAMAATVVVLASCGMESLYNPDAAVERKEAQYEKGFVQKFGEIAPNQDWGFGTATTRGVNVNGNLWYQNWKRPVNVTDDEIEWAKEEFSKKRENAKATQDISWTNYWVQQVYTGNNNYTDGAGNNFNTTDQMNLLQAYNANYTGTEYKWSAERGNYTEETHYEHINNFNKSTNTEVFTDDVTKEKFIGTTLMVDMAMDAAHTGKQFSYLNSKDSKQHFEYIIIEYNGSYYVGFDFYATHPEGQEANKNMDVERDWIFNDWIVKITPAEKLDGTTNPDPQPSKTITYEKRIICEDLGGMGDFDFNDVVFDAYIDKTNNKTYIKLLAAGGTLHLTVAGMEVHEAFGVGQSVMVNTGGTSKEPVTLEVSRTYDSYNDIPIVVSSSTDEAGYFTSYTLKAKIGEAPQKIAVGTDYVWCDEEESIETRYPKFKDFVSDPSLDHSWYSAAGTTVGQVIWTGSWTCSNWNGNQDLAWGGYDWTSFEAGQKLVFTLGFTAPSSYWACIAPRRGRDWANLSCGEKIDLVPSVEDQNVVFEPTTDDINNLKYNEGLVLTGDGYILKKVSIQ